MDSPITPSRLISQVNVRRTRGKYVLFTLLMMVVDTHFMEPFIIYVIESLHDSRARTPTIMFSGLLISRLLNIFRY